MIEQITIAEAVTKVLKENFIGHKVYADEVQEGYRPPAFFIELLPNTTNETINFNSNKLTIVITYLPRCYTAIDNMRVADKLRQIFGLYITVGQRKIKINEIHTTRTGENKEILQVSLITAYFDETNSKRNQYEFAREIKLQEVMK